jgi:hypothetical protein
MTRLCSETAPESYKSRAWYGGGWFFRTRGLLITMLSALCSGGPLLGQAAGQNLPGLLANEGDRQRAVSFVASSRAERVPLLLELAQTTPPGVDEHDLHVGLADVFGALKVTEAIPFLLLNASLRREAIIDLGSWIKTPQSIERSFPAVAALISIGPSASRAAMRAYDQPATPEQRLALLFVVSRVRGVPEARLFLSGALGRANLERFFAHEGMKNWSER